MKAAVWGVLLVVGVLALPLTCMFFSVKLVLDKTVWLLTEEQWAQRSAMVYSAQMQVLDFIYEPSHNCLTKKDHSTTWIIIGEVQIADGPCKGRIMTNELYQCANSEGLSMIRSAHRKNTTVSFFVNQCRVCPTPYIADFCDTVGKYSLTFSISPYIPVYESDGAFTGIFFTFVSLFFLIMCLNFLYHSFYPSPEPNNNKKEIELENKT